MQMLDYTSKNQISACTTSCLEKQWNKADLLNYFNLANDGIFLNSYQIEANLISIRKNNFTIKFIKEWLSYFYTIFNLIDDTKSVLPEAEYFCENRHDQSILSILFYKYHLCTFDFKVREKNKDTGAPFLINRNKNQIDFTKCIQEQENGALVYTSPFIVRGILFESKQEQTLINITLNKTATQSSTSKWSKPNDATRALLGESTNGDFAFHTAEEENPWWMVDLEKEEYIYNIYIQNRIKMCKEKAKTLQVEISLDKENWVLIPNEYLKWTNLDYLNVELLNKYKARYVRLILREKNYFHLAKVEVYALNNKVIEACKILNDNKNTKENMIKKSNEASGVNIKSNINKDVKADIIELIRKQNEILERLL